MKNLVHIIRLLAIFAICWSLPKSSAITKTTMSEKLNQNSEPKVLSEMLVSTDWLAKHVIDPDLFVIHVAAERKHYEDGHIPGARFLSSKEILTTRNGVANELPAVADLQKVFEKLGIGETGRIVIYGENSPLLAARVYFTLDYLGHGARAALLDGGFEKWKAEKLLVETQPINPASAKFTPHPRPQIVASLDSMRALSRDAANAVAIVDARPDEQYAGGQTPRSGHIPGATNIYWLTHVLNRENPAMKSPSVLSKIYEDAGLKTGQKAVTYCNTGIQASHTYFTLKYLGYDVMMYDGSFSEWSSAEGADIIKGKEKK